VPTISHQTAIFLTLPRPEQHPIPLLQRKKATLWVAFVIFAHKLPPQLNNPAI
jgi:hypothetical protein